MSTYRGESLWDLLSPKLITDILSRLPAKPLARFKLVSKRWNSLISHTHILTSYISRPSLPSSNWAILDRIPQLADESTQYATQFNLLDLPKVSTSSINPHKLADEPASDPNQSKYQTAILHSSNGLLLFSVVTLFFNRDPHKVREKDPIHFALALKEESFYVVNPVTNERAPLPKPRKHIKKPAHVAFTTMLDPTTGLIDKFMAVEYQPLIGSDVANLLCFSSDVGKWVEKGANYMLGMHSWRADRSFEFDGRLFWGDLSTGLITWDAPGNDPFVGLETVKAAVCRFIPLPGGCTKPFNTPGLEDERCMGAEGGSIQYIEMFKKGSNVFKLWRLKDCEAGEWGFMYKVSRDDVERNLACVFEKGMPKPCFVHPLESDVVYFETGHDLFSLNVRTLKVESCTGFAGHEFVLPMVLPKWPSPLPKGLFSAYAKEHGNECFKNQNFSEAIKCYSRSIIFSPNAAAFSNRAMSYLKVKKFHEAENDCTEALKLDPNYSKVYWRRALARKELGYLKAALKDVEFGLKLEPKNEQVMKLCAELKSMLDKESCEGQELDQKGAASDMDVDGK